MTRQVMSDKELIKKWIQYLKNNQIVSMQSDPSGRLKYAKKVTSADVKHFLQVEGNFSDEDIDKAIASVRKPSTAVATVQPQQDKPKQPQQPPKPKQYDNSDATDVEPRYGPRPALPPGPRPGLPRPVREDITDDSGVELSEPEVEHIFDTLTSAAAAASDAAAEPKAPPPAADPKVEINQLKRVIRDKMTDAQRRSLWHALNDATVAPPEPVTESAVSNSDINAIFNAAANLRQAPKSKWNFFKPDKPKITLDDLKREYEKERPDDLRDIQHMLKNVGYDDAEINKVFSEVFGSDDNDEYQEPTNSPAVTKIAEYIKSKGMEREIIAFMKQEYPEIFNESYITKKVMIEDIEKILVRIVREDRNALPRIAKATEHIRLGRNKK